MSITTRNILVLIMFSCLCLRVANAQVKLPPVFGSNMVLQQQIALPVWGTAAPGEQIVITFAGETARTVANADGKWWVKLPSQEVGGPYEMVIQGTNRLVFANVLVGEVWVCSGQSNMAFGLLHTDNAEAEIAATDYPSIRLLTVKPSTSNRRVKNVSGQWYSCTPKSAAIRGTRLDGQQGVDTGGFSAVAYFFGRELHNALNVPIGLIHSSCGGGSAEAWTSLATLRANPDLERLVRRWYSAEEPIYHHPANLYNAMMAPLIPYAIRGAIWYQGESNASRAYQYRTLFPALICDWRGAWRQGDFPFYYVQLANYGQRKDSPGESTWAELCEAQLMTLNLPNTGMAVINDIGAANNIHPTNKQDVGHRLALNALAKTYGRDVPYSGPIYDSMTVEDSAIRLHFKHTDGGLIANGGELESFAIAGDDRNFVWGNAIIDGETVVVSSPAVPDPVAVRYAWTNNPEATLYNGAGLPASLFRTGNWP